ncbi:MAG TPA: sigma-70 family RNA polymerase sigma factor [Lacipirellulaceae bacterium]|nr:sigma-70 family RNA polymerase sigma factor [Lacipirellulaceae bacterium]
MPTNAEDRRENDSAELDREEFARQYSRNARRIYGFILTLVFNHHDAEEVFQNTSVVLWNKFAEFRPGSNFFAWASRVAYFEVLSFTKQRRRLRVISGETLELLAEQAVALADESSARQEALEDCLSRLSTTDRDLLHARYYCQQPPKQIAALQYRSVDSVYRALSRIHNTLLNCVQRNLANEEPA